MKLILSRKGFDSATGGVPSPIVDGTPVSMPIPAGRRSPETYADAGLGDLVEQITKGRLRRIYHCHHDPMFAAGRCAFGQVGASQSHLERQGVGPGDVFVFWGLFSPLGGKAAHHRIFAFLDVEEVISAGPRPSESLQPRGFPALHPHLRGRWRDNNTLYVGAGGLAASDDDFLRLTAPGEKRVTRWRVPAWLRNADLSYHGDSARWGAHDEASTVRLRAVGRGQEFVADLSLLSPGERALAMSWLDAVRDACPLGQR